MKKKIISDAAHAYEKAKKYLFENRRNRLKDDGI
jgi:hypothetical protein